jgi:hypothetical protein
VADVLATYLNDHLAGSAAGIQLGRRCAKGHAGTELGALLERFVEEFEEDRSQLEDAMERLGVARNAPRQATALAGEMLSRVRHVVPVVGSTAPEAIGLEDLELLSLGIEGRRMLWHALRELGDARLRGSDLAALEDRAREEREQLEPFRLAAVRRAATG